MIRERQNHVRIENYFERIKPLKDFWSHFRISRTTVSRLEHLLLTCPGLPHGQRNGGRHTIDLQKQVLITIWILGNPECLRSVADRFNITKSILFRVYRRICGAIANNLSGQFTKHLFEIEHRWAKWLISDPSPKGTRWINDPSSDRADQWSDKSLSRVDLINHWSENGFARKERHRSEILIQITPKERTISLKTLFLFLSFQWHWLSWRTRLWGSRRGDGFLRLTVEILAILRLTLHFLPLWLDWKILRLTFLMTNGWNSSNFAANGSMFSLFKS